MPMIDIYAPAGIFPDVHRLASDAAAAVKEIEQVPDIAMFRQNTGAFVHEMPMGTISDVDGDGGHVRVQVLPSAGSAMPAGTPLLSLVRRPPSRVRKSGQAFFQSC